MSVSFAFLALGNQWGRGLGRFPCLRPHNKFKVVAGPELELFLADHLCGINILILLLLNLSNGNTVNF